MAIPAGVIAAWRGTIANIPAGWDLCDGNGGRPNLLAKFLKSVPDAVTDPGTTGGSDTHTHVESGTGGAHDHDGTSGSGGAHQHTTPTTTGSHPYSAHGTQGYQYSEVRNCGEQADGGNHNHTWPSGGAHTHSIDSQGAHAHTLQNADTRPAYYEVAFIYSDGSPVTFAEGIIALWSDVLGNIPTGFTLDTSLVAKFLRCVPAATEPGTTGGADSHAHTQNAAGAHTHTLAANANHSHTSNSAGSHGHGSSWYYQSGVTAHLPSGMWNRGNHTHGSGTATGHTHTAQSAGSHSHTMNSSDGRPPFYELAPIKAGVGGVALAVGTICIWTGTLANIPADWALCDGSGDTPNLLDKFIRGVATDATDPGNTGGNTTHTHTTQAAGDHTHTPDSQGAHIHTASNSTWSHYHGQVYWTNYSALMTLDPGYYGPSHNHGNLSSTGAHIDHSITTSGDHSDHTYGTASSLPAYYEVAFIYCTAAAVAYEKTLTESLGLVDVYSRTWTIQRVYSELLGLVDVYSRIWTVYRTYSELLALVDSVQKEPGKLFAEPLGLVDTYSRTWSIYRTYTELLGLLDSIQKGPGKVLSEPLGLLDTYNRTWSIKRTYVEELGLVDTFSRVQNIHRTFTELLGLLDSIQKKPSKTFTEKLGVADTFLQLTWHDVEEIIEELRVVFKI